MAKLVPIFSVVAGIYWTIAAFGYGLWVNHGPGGGVFPLAAGVILIPCGGMSIYKQIRNHTEVPLNRDAAYPFAAVIFSIAASYAIGLIPALALYVVLWLKGYEKKTWANSLFTGAVTGVALFLIFSYWLKVPVPIGIFEQLLY
ncbi:tripartite tricarboxylate transporter TctB family protein [Clostridium sp. AM58-1XD]|uniref:tripartite tricarboxylate transporter TctB family protein n=1 Tax=Clostridium sp. AM58-1XD TaxID=2292307 RepID=UPI000E472654|nr:tripartite tricarboxylate transporter TctB family protein [Clostridium sp. AM58-1XD]RGY97826.1 tripartite tricarboxylate transporter TctB family protein [Clostridium sp. AM58-1XD]